jgi:hypothetical protein
MNNRTNKGPAHSIDEELEWSPIRDIPELFQPDIDEGQRLLARYRHKDDLDALERLVKVWDDLVIHPNFHSTPETFQLDMLNRSGVALNWRGALVNNQGDKSRAMARFTEVLKRAPSGWADTPRYLHNRAAQLADNYLQKGALKDLEEGIKDLEQGISLSERIEDASSRTRVQALCLGRLADLLLLRYSAKGDPNDLEQSRKLAEQSVRLTSAKSYRQPEHTRILIEALKASYQSTGNLGDLQRAIELASRLNSEEKGAGSGATEDYLGVLLRERFRQAASNALRLALRSLRDPVCRYRSSDALPRLRSREANRGAPGGVKETER